MPCTSVFGVTIKNVQLHSVYLNTASCSEKNLSFAVSYQYVARGRESNQLHWAGDQMGRKTEVVKDNV